MFFIKHTLYMQYAHTHKYAHTFIDTHMHALCTSYIRYARTHARTCFDVCMCVYYTFHCSIGMPYRRGTMKDGVCVCVCVSMNA